MDAREDLPKISIETEQDWRRIQQNLSTALLARLDAELNAHGQAGDKDALLPHAHQFLESLFDVARPNLRINGRTSTADEPCGDEDGEHDHAGVANALLTGLDMEPFDEALDRHIWSLSDQRLKWDKEVADRRRSRPSEIAKSLVESLTQHHACDVGILEKSDAQIDLDAPQVDPELQHTLSTTVSMAPQLLQAVKSQRMRANKIKSVSAEVKALKP